MTPEQREAREHERLISMAFENLPTTTEVTRDDVDAILTWVLPEVRMTPEQQAVIDAVRAWIRTNHEDTAYVTLLDAVQALDDAEAAHKSQYGIPPQLGYDVVHGDEDVPDVQDSETAR
jgi:ABC-type branched-subunit amino acid transport system substrate-binding protein